jgi:ribosome-associated protein
LKFNPTSMIEQPFSTPEFTDKQQRCFEIPEQEILISYARSGGAGGQNVNKRDTKAHIKWHIRESTAFTEEQKAILEQGLRNWINDEGYVFLSNQETRSQEQNKQNAIDRLNTLVEEALIPEKKRVPTKPTRSSKLRRLDDKTRTSTIKKLRGKIERNDTD